jgi:hypothetical protein
MDIKKMIKEAQEAQEEKKEDIYKEIEKQFSLLDESAKEQVKKAFIQSLDEKIEEAREVIKRVDVYLALSDVAKYISLSQIAKDYFGKSRYWLYQRIKRSVVNGKPAEFTPSDREKLAKALKDIADRLTESSVKIA